MEVATVVGNVLGPVLAHGGVAAVAAVSELVAEAARGRVGHDPVVVEGNPALRVRLVKSAQLFVGIWHDIGITKSFFQRVQISTPDCGISEGSEHRHIDLRGPSVSLFGHRVTVLGLLGEARRRLGRGSRSGRASPRGSSSSSRRTTRSRSGRGGVRA